MMMHSNRLAIFLWIVCCLPGLAMAESLTDGLENVTVIEGDLMTGSNRFVGEPVWNMGIFGTNGFNFVFGWNPEGDEPLPLSPESPPDTILATGVDPFFMAIFGLSPDVVEAQFVNVPLHQNSVIVNASGNREQVPSVLEAGKTEISKALPNEPITLERWSEARGRAVISCFEDGTARVTIRAQRLIENGLYIVLGFTGAIGSFGNFLVTALPVGGVPNVFVTDGDGNGYYDRIVGRCPVTDDPDVEGRLLFILVTYNSDGGAYGGVANVPALGFPSGIVSHGHLGFPINVTRLEE